MRIQLKKISAVLILFVMSSPLLAQIDNGDLDRINLSGGSIATSVPFLLISPDARSGSLGDVGVASSPDINSQHWNAAKYPFIGEKSGISLTYSPWLRVLVSDMNLLYLSGYRRMDENSVLAGSLRFFSLGQVVFRDSYEGFPSTFNPNEYSVDISYSRKLSDYFSIAVVGRYIRSDLTQGYNTGASKSSAANSGAADISMFYTRDIITSNTEGSSFAIGLNISNIGAKVSYSESMAKDFLPANIRLGGSYSVQVDQYNEISAMLDFSKLLVPTPPVRDSINNIIAGMDPDVTAIQAVFQSFHDAPGGFREELREINICTGVEYLYNKAFAFRGGYFYEHKEKGGRRYFTLGAGLKLSILEVDFSYLLPASSNANNPLKNTLRFTLKFNISEYVRKQNEPTATE